MSIRQDSRFLHELETIAERVGTKLLEDSYPQRISTSDLRDAVTLYVRSGGKRLRPAILLWSCGVVGGDPERALPAAAAVELFHTWSLVHDDIIDRDETRRGVETVHQHYSGAASSLAPYLNDDMRAHYGLSLALLAGDVQHGWSTTLLTELSSREGVDPAVTLALIERMEREVLSLLVEGELLDIQYSRMPIASLTVDAVEEMLWKKTGVLYSFCAEAGAMIGLGTADRDQPEIRSLSEFAGRCGIAFQLQDDLLGVLGDPASLGKPVGSDIREGKRTTLVLEAWRQGSEEQRAEISAVLGREDASDDVVRNVVVLLEELGGVQATRERARHHIEEALPLLETLPAGPYRDLLEQWADFLVSRQT